VAFGPFLSRERIIELTEGLPQQEAWRLCAALTQRIVENLRDGVSSRLDIGAVRAAWNGERLGQLPEGGRRVPARAETATRRGAP
jgi:hypothetical protein